MSMKRYILRYLLCTGIPYVVARAIEKRYLENLKKINDQNELDHEKEPFAKLDGIDTNGLKTRGGVMSVLVSWFMKDFAFRVAVTTTVGGVIYNDATDAAVAQLVKYSGSIIAAPGKSLARIVKRLNKLDPAHSKDLKELLLDSEITKLEKLELLKVKLKYVLRNLKGRKRELFISSFLALLIFVYGKDSGLFAFFAGSVRDVIGKDDNEDSIQEYLIDIYREYNAPFPKELINQILK